MMTQLQHPCIRLEASLDAPSPGKCNCNETNSGEWAALRGTGTGAKTERWNPRLKQLNVEKVWVRISSQYRCIGPASNKPSSGTRVFQFESGEIHLLYRDDIHSHSYLFSTFVNMHTVQTAEPDVVTGILNRTRVYVFFAHLFSFLFSFYHHHRLYEPLSTSLRRCKGQ